MKLNFFLSSIYSHGSTAKNKLGKFFLPTVMLNTHIVSYECVTFDIWPWCSGTQPGSGVDEQLSSSSIFEHVDRLSRGSSDGTRRVSNKIQLIAMQPMPSPPSYPHNQALSPNLTDKMPDGANVNSEVSKQAHILDSAFTWCLTCKFCRIFISELHMTSMSSSRKHS